MIDSDGFFSAKVSVPLGDFTLTVKDINGAIKKQEIYTAKYYAMFLEVAAQSYEERLVAIRQAKEDLDYSTIRSERLYPVVGVNFDFPPPPGWTAEMYRHTLLGHSPDCPGFTSAFFYGGTTRGIVEVIKSITCSDVVVSAAQAGERWVVFDNTHKPDPTDPTNPDSWFVSDTNNIDAPNHRIFLFDNFYPYSTVRLTISGAQRTIVDESVLKATNSYIESPRSQDFDLNGKTLKFSFETLGESRSSVSYQTTFGAITTAADAAAAILAQNPTLSNAVYAESGKLRIGLAPASGKVYRITMLAGTALESFGFSVGQSADVAPDILNNPWQITPVILTDGVNTFVDGVDFVSVPQTGEIVWNPSSATQTNIPAAGAVLLASYTYLMRREIEAAVNLVKSFETTVEFVYV